MTDTAKDPSRQDPFAVLTQAPSSPSSSRSSVFHIPAPSSPLHIAKSIRNSSKEPSSPTSSEFGSFVSVSAADDPLAGGTPSTSNSKPEEEASRPVVFGGFGDEARRRAERNGRRVLDELRAHEHDPLAWLSATDQKQADADPISSVSVSATDSPLISSPPSGPKSKPTEENSESGLPGDDATRRTTHNGRHVLDELRAHEDDPLAWLGSGRDDSGTNTENPIMSALREAGSTLIDLSTPTSEAPPPTRPRASSPPIPRTSSDTVLHRVNSRSPPTSRSWMSALLSSPRAAPVPPSSSASALASHEAPRAASPEQAGAGAAGLSPTQSSLHALFARAHAPATARHGRYATDGHAATLPLPATKSTLDAAPSPFAAHSFVAPSGAPGFAGDRNWNTAGFEFDGGNGAQGRTLTLVGRKEPTNPVLDGALANLLRPHLPALARLPHSWSLLYSSDQHGLSLKTLYARCAPAPTRKEAGKLSPAGSLVAVQDADGGVFGAWVGEGVHLSHGGYYGGGDSFLWRVDPYEPHALSVYNWTGRNDYVAFCDTDFFSFGGGDGHYGLYLDGSLVEGTTHPCPTFDNECLAQGTRKGRMIAFECVGLEVWGIGP